MENSEIKKAISKVRMIIFLFPNWDRSIPLESIKDSGGKVDINHLLTLIKKTLIEMNDEETILGEEQ